MIFSKGYAAATMLLILGVILVQTTCTLAYSCYQTMDNDGRRKTTTEFEHVVVVDLENGVNDSTCYPSSPGVPAITPCADLNFALKFPNRVRSTKFVLLPGKVPYYLQNNSEFENAFNVAFIGNGSVHSIVECALGAGLSFMNSTEITLENLHFRFCGALHNSTSKNFREREHQSHNSTSTYFPYQLSFVSLYFHNCTNITMYGIAVNESRNATGVAMYDTAGYNYISNCIFYKNIVDPNTSQYAGGGGFAIEFTFCPPGQFDCNTATYFKPEFSRYKRNRDACYVFYNCTFQNNIAIAQAQLSSSANQKMDKFVVLHHNETHEIFGRGAGILLFFKGEALNNRIEIKQCNFLDNHAVWGGAITIAYKDNSIDNSFFVQNSRFDQNQCFRTLDYETGGGAIIIVSSLEMWNFDSDASREGNRVSIKDSVFNNNYCLHGGAIYYFLALQLGIETVGLNVTNCSFTSNTGRLGSAVKVSPYLVFGGTDPRIVFSNCVFENNIVDNKTYSPSTDFYRVGLGAMYINGIPVTFQSDMKFLYNVGSAIGVVATYINCTNTTLSFVGNSGRDGGGIALLGAATILIGNETNMTFKDNHVSRFGGAIYSVYIGREHMKGSVRCFVHYSNPFKRQNEWISSFTFQNNSAKYLGNSIFVTSIYPCSWNNDNISSVFCNNSHWRFLSTTGGNVSCLDEIYTEPQSFNVTNNSAIPGEGFTLNITAHDDLQHDVTKETVYSAYTLDADVSQVDPRFRYVAAEYIGIVGEENQTISLELETANSRVTHVHVQIELKQCPPGMFANHSSVTDDPLVIKCQCRKDYTFENKLRCIEFSDKFETLILAQYWYGEVNGTFLMGVMPSAFVHFSKKDNVKRSGFLSLPSDPSELDKTLCGPSNRKGILCGKCIDGHATPVNSLQRFECIKCGENTTFALNIFAYVSLTFVPYAFLYGIIIFFNVKLMSSAANSFILFAQLVSAGIFPIDGEKLKHLSDGQHFYLTKRVYTLFYGLFNLDSFSLLMHPFCVSKHFTTLDVLCLDYAIALFPLLVIVVVWFMKSRCGCNCFKTNRRPSIRRPAPQIESNTSPKGSLVHAFIAFMFLSYTKFSLASMRILITTRLFNEDGTPVGPYRVLYAGHYPLESKEFMFPYGFITLFILVFFVFLPPFLLLGPLNLVDRLLDKPTFSFLRRFWPTITIHSFMDAAFHGYKLNRRNFAGVYLLFRLIVFLNYSFNANLHLWLSIQQIICTIMLLLVAIFQPHQKAFFNYVDMFILLNLVILNSLSIYIFNIQIEGAPDQLSTSIYIVEYVLVWLPLLYITSYLIWVLLLQKLMPTTAIKNWFSAKLNIEANESEDNRPLLRPEVGENNSGEETDNTLSDEEMFKRAERQNLYRPATPDNGSNSSSRQQGTNTATGRSGDSTNPSSGASYSIKNTQNYDSSEIRGDGRLCSRTTVSVTKREKLDTD